MGYLLPYLNFDKSFNVKFINDTVIIKCNDKLNIHNISFLAKIMDSLISQNNGLILVDMNDLQHVDSTGLGVLFVTMNRLKKINISFKLIGLSDYIHNLFSGLDIDTLCEVYENEEDAIKSMAVQNSFT